MFVLFVYTFKFILLYALTESQPFDMSHIQVKAQSEYFEG